MASDILSPTAQRIMATSAHTIDDPPPLYTNEASASSRIGPSDPPLASILKPSHSTSASRLAYATSQGKYSTLEYMELTFSIIVMCNGLRAPVVVAIEEDISTLMADIQRMFHNKLNNRKIFELRVEWCGSPASRDFGSGFHLSNGNATAMLRLLKSRNGVDTISAR